MATTNENNDNDITSQLALFPKFLLNLDRDLETRFLGDNLSEICGAAYEADIPILKAFAASPLDKRKEALAVWRAETVKNWLADATFAVKLDAFFKTASLEIVESFHSGNMPLFIADTEIKNRWQACETDRQRMREAAKHRIWNALSFEIEDLDERHVGKTIPRQVLFLENGDISFWRYRLNAVRFAKSAGMMCVIMGIDGTRVKTWNLESPSALTKFEAENEANETDEMDDFSDRNGLSEGPSDDVPEE